MKAIKLNLGCGDDILNDYINVDLRDIPNVVNCDVRNLDKIVSKGTVEEIRAIDVLEHIPYNETLSVLKHWNDILRPNGLLFIQSPCLKSLANYILKCKTPSQIENAISRIFGGQDYQYNFHCTCIDETLITKYLKESGFTKIPKFETKFGNGTNIRVWVRK